MEGLATAGQQAVRPSVSARFAVEPPLHLGLTLAQAQLGPLDPCLRLGPGGAWRASRTPLGLATERLQVLPDGSLQVDAWGPGAAWLVERATALCGAADDPGSFQPAEPLLRRLMLRFAGLRIGRTEAVFETAMAVTLEQRVAPRDAWRSWQRLVRSLGEPAPGPLAGLWAPPAPERIARTPYEVFHRFGIERRRSDVLRRLAVVARRLEETASLPLETAYARLRAIPGVGPWTAAYVAHIALGDRDAVATGDLHLPHLVARALAGEARGTDERMLELLEPFRGHRARVLRLLMASAWRSP